MEVTLKKNPPKPKLEKVIQKEIVNYLNSLPGCSADVMTVSGYMRPGIADIIGVLDGRYIAIEVKRPGGKKATPIQLNWLKNKRRYGAIVGVATDVEETKKIILDSYN